MVACFRKLPLLRVVEGEAEEDDGLLMELLRNPLSCSLNHSLAISPLAATDVPGAALLRKDLLHSVHLDDAALSGFEEIQHAPLPVLGQCGSEQEPFQAPERIETRLDTLLIIDEVLFDEHVSLVEQKVGLGVPVAQIERCQRDHRALKAFELVGVHDPLRLQPEIFLRNKDEHPLHFVLNGVMSVPEIQQQLDKCLALTRLGNQKGEIAFVVNQPCRHIALIRIVLVALALPWPSAVILAQLAQLTVDLLQRIVSPNKIIYPLEALLCVRVHGGAVACC